MLIASPDKKFFASVFRAMSYQIKRYRLKIKIRQVMQLNIDQVTQSDLDMLQQRLSAAAVVYRHIAFGRLFHLWHLLHMPLFFMLIITGIVHVIAVHMY
ncbi:MAG: hypothetical protein KZQ64_14960 [gamma proteobacterium symbiont of Bathyaustriella thionipta]|nr:hypothetical protein [gamma proteobacterium symbiont of Bathyaustriella thionipta]MCU7949352.1 hypothetical protein [gamma proteobacterium symbiont of Bathyaustriella thionipta]MCU7954668.1 hypothetical protein [gamma proteobacterium symbiont of Bathyaustriella thionipta]MCU7955953.1 hypothetical protein [gamma proteobacterium symbiont of Bathyaustriella thionipta]MCU7965824.1 hypothetical protein [gamma proteobacterium symbiont of Bathyaustriella thionipta]